MPFVPFAEWLDRDGRVPVAGPEPDRRFATLRQGRVLVLVLGLATVAPIPAATLAPAASSLKGPSPLIGGVALVIAAILWLRRWPLYGSRPLVSHRPR